MKCLYALIIVLLGVSIVHAGTRRMMLGSGTSAWGTQNFASTTFPPLGGWTRTPEPPIGTDEYWQRTAGYGSGAAEGHNGSLYRTATFNGSGTVTFKVLTATLPGGYSTYMEFYIDGASQAHVTSSTPTTYGPYSFASGSHTFRWMVFSTYYTGKFVIDDVTFTKD